MKDMLRKTSNKMKLGSAIFAGGAVLCGVAIYTALHPTDRPFISLGNFPDGAAVETFLQTGRQTTSVAANGNVIDLPETLGAIGAGVILGTLAMRTRSIWGGVLIHIGVAVTMDVLALRGCPPFGSNRYCGS